MDVQAVQVWRVITPNSPPGIHHDLFCLVYIVTKLYEDLKLYVSLSFCLSSFLSYALPLLLSLSI